MRILCLIPARSGSKGIPHKNIRLFCGKPLLTWAIEQAKASKHPMRIIVSTDSPAYAEIARAAGAEVPFLRPAEISQDHSIDEEFIVHALNWLETHEGYQPDIILYLRPTYPTRTVETVDACLDRFLEVRDQYDSLRTVVPAEKTPFKMYVRCDDATGPRIEPIVRTYGAIHEPFNNCRQSLPDTYVHNGCIDMLNASIVPTGSISGPRIYPFIMNKDDTFDIDTTEEWLAAEKKMLERQNGLV